MNHCLEQGRGTYQGDQLIKCTINPQSYPLNQQNITIARIVIIIIIIINVRKGGTTNTHQPKIDQY